MAGVRTFVRWIVFLALAGAFGVGMVLLPVNRTNGWILWALWLAATWMVATAVERRLPPPLGSKRVRR